MWVGASQLDARQPIRTSVSENKEAVYGPIGGASWDEEQTIMIPRHVISTPYCHFSDIVVASVCVSVRLSVGTSVCPSITSLSAH